MKKKNIVRKRYIFVLSLILGFGLFAFVPSIIQSSISFAQSIPTRIINVSNTPTVKSVFPVILQDQFLRTHIAWLEYNPSEEPRSHLYYTTFQSGRVNKPIEITDETGIDRGPILAMEVNNGMLHFMYTAYNKRLRHIVVQIIGEKATIKQKTWLTPEDVKGYGSTLVTDTKGNVHAVWVDNRSGEGEYRLYHKMYRNGEWEDDERRVARRNVIQLSPALVATSDGLVHASLRVGEGMGFYTFDGARWREEAPPQPARINGVALGANGGGIHAVWSNSQNGHSVFYAKRTDAGWTQPKQLDTDSTFDDAPAIIVGRDKVYGLWSSGTNFYALEVVAREIRPDGTLMPLKKIAPGPSYLPKGVRAGPTTLIIWQNRQTKTEEVFMTDLYGMVPPPSPPCDRFGNGSCLEITTSLGLLCTKANCVADIVFVVFLSLTGGIGVLLIMYAGYIFMTSRDKKEQVQKGREIITAAIVGLMFIIFSLIIMTTITTDILRLPGFSK